MRPTYSANAAAYSLVSGCSVVAIGSAPRSGQVHLPQHRLEARLSPKRAKQEGSSDAEDAAGPLLVGTLQEVHRLILLSQPLVHIGEMIGRDVPLLRHLFQ